MDVTTILLPVLSLGGMGLVFGLGLGYAGVKFKVEEDERLPLVREALPGANCGGCGFAGCDAFATAVLKGEAKTGGCPVGGVSTAAKIGEIMGVSADIFVRKVSFVKCAGCGEKTRNIYMYSGINDCTAITHLVAGGPKSCGYGCLGGGNCQRVCQFGAIEIHDGLARVNAERCTACGKCVEACPRKLIELVPYEAAVKVVCSSKDNGKLTKQNCEVGCIGCKMCTKVCETDAITVENFIAAIDYDKCTCCGECVKKCPAKAIKETVN